MPKIPQQPQNRQPGTVVGTQSACWIRRPDNAVLFDQRVTGNRGIRGMSASTPVIVPNRIGMSNQQAPPGLNWARSLNIQHPLASRPMDHGTGQLLEALENRPGLGQWKAKELFQDSGGVGI
jgi:hypothetical protein